MSSKKIKTFKLQKWLCFGAAIAFAFLPTIIAIACVFPFIKNADTGYKVALGTVMVIINTVPFMMNAYKGFIAHFPFLNTFAICFCLLGAFFSLEFFSEYQGKFFLIEGVAALGSIAACVCWALYKHYAHYVESVKAGIKSGAFVRS